MIIYSVTVSIEQEIEADWLPWMLEEHLPEVMASGYFNRYDFHKIIEPIVDPDRTSYNVLYEIESLEKLNDYRRTAGSILQEKQSSRFGESALAIRSILERR